MSLGIKSTWWTGSRKTGSASIIISHIRRRRGPRAGPSISSLTTISSSDHEIADNDGSEANAAQQKEPINATSIGLQVPVELVNAKHPRNAFFRDAFRVNSSDIQEGVQTKRNSPYVPAARDYPSPETTKSSLAESRRVARVLVGLDMIWESFNQRVPLWNETFSLLKRMTPKRSETPNMSAVRIVLPPSWHMPVGTKRLEYLDAATGLATKLRVCADRENPSSSLVLRGESAVLAKAADELIRACPEVEVFKLGEVATFDYKVKRLWPSIGTAAEGELPVASSSSSSGETESMWLHEEVQTYWIDRPYEKTPKPAVWTKESFITYITALVCGKMQPYLAMKYYQQPRINGKRIDTDGIRVQLISDAFEDPSARESITPHALKLALAFMSQRGGHRVSADRLLSLAEKWGLPMDTDMFNIILDGYVSKRDAAFFHRVLQKMEMRYFCPNARTWLHFLKLVQRDDERRQIIVAMYEIGLFQDPATRRGIAQVMASHDAHTAFKAGKSLDVFMADQATRYGQDWFTREALNPILQEFLRFQGKDATRMPSFQALMERPYDDGRAFDISTSHTILSTCLENKDWTTALWALSHMHKHSCEPNHQTYGLLIYLAIITSAPSCLAVIFFYGLLKRKLRRAGRRPMQAILLRNRLSKSPVKIFPRKMASVLRRHPVAAEESVVAGVEWAILRSLDGYKPVRSLAAALDVAWRTMDLPSMRKARQADSRKDEGDAKAIEPHDFAIKLRDGKRKRPSMIVHLDAAFEPETMIRNWRGRAGKESSLAVDDIPPAFKSDV